MKLPIGFQTSGVSANIKASGKKDVGLIHSSFPLYWAVTSTQNEVRAPFIFRNLSRYATGQAVHGVIVNSGNANCANGDQGVWDNEDFAGSAAHALSYGRVQDMLSASTGIIGHRLPVDKVRACLPALTAGLSDDSDDFAEAILTTDTKTKQVGATLTGGARIVGVAKGSGMVHPNMATMLAFVMTDAAIPQTTLRELWPQLIDRSFNQVTVDGDTSPNDTAMLFSSHQVGANAQEFAEALDEVCQRLAKKIARDGEGATKLMTVNVHNARSSEEARRAARAVARSSLVKAAAHGNDPNWGRILVAVGSANVVFDKGGLHIKIQGTTVYKGTPQTFDAESLSKQMDSEDLIIDIDLAAGVRTGTAWGCDLTAEYVSINADYHT